MSYTEERLQEIADAIREKDETTEPIAAEDFADRIRAISSGVRSFNGRTGVVASKSGDYTAEMVGALSEEGGTLYGNLTINPTGTYGGKLNFGDGDFVHISEPKDDFMEVKAKGIDFVVNEYSGSTDTTFTINGKPITSKLDIASQNSPSFTGSISMGRTVGDVGEGSVAVGNLVLASGENSFATGRSSKATGETSYAEGLSCLASASCSHAEGCQTEASGMYSHAGGFGTVAEYFAQTSIGECNVRKNPENSYSVGDLFVVGKGTSNAEANAFRVRSTGACYGNGAWNSSGADYAELFEWIDKNPNMQDRVGHFVTLVGNKIRIATQDDDFILGIVSGNPSVVGDVHDDQWQGMYMYDVFGRPLWENVNVPEVKDEGGNVVIPEHTERRQKLNPDYDNTKQYKPRTERPEWDAVGMLGKLIALDDGTCEVDGWCGVGRNGIATYSLERTNYRVIARIDESHIQVLVV